MSCCIESPILLGASYLCSIAIISWWHLTLLQLSRLIWSIEFFGFRQCSFWSLKAIRSQVRGQTDPLGTCQVSHLIFPCSLLESEVRWFISCSWWLLSSRSLSLANTHPYWISVIDWTLQLIGLIWDIQTSFEFHTGVKTDNRLNWSVLLPSFRFDLFSDLPSS